jgi:hypothetical protein
VVTENLDASALAEFSGAFFRTQGIEKMLVMIGGFFMIFFYTKKEI